MARGLKCWTSFVGLALAMACGRTGPGEAVVQVEGEPVTLAEFEIYLARNLLQDRDLESRDEAYERMMSRLLDRFVEQEVLRREAIRRGVQVDEAEFEFYLSEFYSIEGEEEAVDAPLDDSSRARLMEGIRVQKFRDRLFQLPVEEDETAIRAYLEANRESLRPKTQWTLQSLTFEDGERADEVYSLIRGGRMSFSEAVVFYGEQEDESEPVRLEPESLPPPVREAVDRLRPGDTAPPQRIAGRWHLFYLLDRFNSNTESDSALYERARRAWTESRRREALEAEVARLVDAAEVRIHEGKLPFRYRASEALSPPPLAGETDAS